MKVADYLKAGVDLFQKHPLEWVIAWVIVVVMSATLVLAGPALAGLVFMAVKARRGEKPEVLDLFKGFDHFLNSLFASVILLAICVCSAVLGFLPGIGWFLSSIFSILALPVASGLVLYAMPLVVDRGLGWKPALRASLARASKDLVGHLVFGLANTIVCLIPFIGLPIHIGAVLAAYADASSELVGLASKG